MVKMVPQGKIDRRNKNGRSFRQTKPRKSSVPIWENTSKENGSELCSKEEKDNSFSTYLRFRIASDHRRLNWFHKVSSKALNHQKRTDDIWWERKSEKMRQKGKTGAQQQHTLTSFRNARWQCSRGRFEKAEGKQSAGHFNFRVNEKRSNCKS